MFSRRCAREDVPGMSNMLGERCRSQESATCMSGVGPMAVASVLLGAIAGVSRRLVESKDSQSSYPASRRELDAFARGYAMQLQRTPPG